MQSRYRQDSRQLPHRLLRTIRHRRSTALRSRSLLLEQLESRSLLATVTLTAVADNTMYEESGDLSNGAGDSLFVGRTAGLFSTTTRRALVRFNLASIPAGTQIDSVTLRMSVTKVPGGSPTRTVALHRVTAAWGEGTSDATGGAPGSGEGDGTQATTNDATWTHRLYPNTMWTAPGGDFVGTASATTQVAGFGTNPQWTGMVTDVQGWVNATATNFGWILMDTNEATIRTAKSYGSYQNGNPNTRPQLTVEFSSANNAPTNVNLSNATVPENADTTGPLLIGNLTAVDPDVGDTHTFQLVTGAGSADNDLFQITGTRLELRAGTELDFETKPQLQVRVETTDAGGQSFARAFVITVTNINEAPTLNPITDPTPILEDAGLQIVSLGGITAGPGESQVLTVTATSNNLALIPNPTVNYTSPNQTGSLSYTPAPNQSGTAVITVRVTDSGGIAGGGENTITRAFTVSVTAVNDAPTLDTINNPAAILEDAASQSINLSGISAGGGESQTLTISATSSNVALTGNPSVTYVSPNATGSLSYTPAANLSGTAVITVTVNDGGGVANGGVDRVSRSFTVSVTPVNDAPTLNVISDPAPIQQDAGAQAINLAGISAGGGETQILSVTALSDNIALIPNPTVSYTNPNATGSLSYTPVAGQSGSAIITVTVGDNGGVTNGGVNSFSRTFTVTVLPQQPNQAPTLDAILNPAAILEDATAQTVNLSGITAGGSETQLLTVTARSDNDGLIPNPAVTYSSPNQLGSLSYAPVANKSGNATITVTVMDNGGVLAGGVNTTTRTFTVSVTPVNDAPSFTKGPDQSVVSTSGAQTVNAWATNLVAGPPDEAAQTFTFTVTNNSNSLFAVQPAIDPTGRLTYTPAAGAVGTATVTVTLGDSGGIANGGVNSSGSQTFTITVRAAGVWHNGRNRLDVNDDTQVTPLDALIIFNRLNSVGSGEVPANAPPGPPFYDTNNDEFVTPLDALIVFNFLNSGGGEGESSGEQSTASSQPRTGDDDLGELIAALAADIAQQSNRRRR